MECNKIMLAGPWVNSEWSCQILPENVFKRPSYWSSNVDDISHFLT